jgi:putative membrane protein
MRVFYFLILVLILGAVVLFAVQNQQDVTLTFLNVGLTASVALVIGAVYLLGMLSGGTLLGLVRRSLHRATESRDQRR